MLFVHSAGSQRPGEGSSHLVAYLKASLGHAYEVQCPEMPDPEHPRYALWKARLEEELIALAGEVVLAGHSLGGSILLKYLSEESCTLPIAGLFLVAAPYWGKEEWEVDEYLLVEDFAATLPPIRNTFLYQSRDDEVVPFSHMAYYREKLPGAEVRELQGFGHEFRSGLPQLVHDIVHMENTTPQAQ